MKQLFLVKSSPHVQIGHIYEHIFCTQLVAFFRLHKLFSYIDYDLNAKTYYDGHVSIELVLYTKDAVAHEGEIKSIRIPADSENSIDVALIQIFAEKQVDLESIDKTYVKSLLRDLDRTAWQQKKELPSFEATDDVTQDGLVFYNKTARHFLPLRQTVSISKKYLCKDYATRAPLFAVISRILTTNLQELIANSSLCYSLDDTFHKMSREFRDINVYRIDKRQATKLTSELGETKKIIEDILEAGMIKKLSNYLLAASRDAAYGTPDEDEIYRKIDLYLKDNDWHTIGTTENIKDVLQHMEVSFKLGRDKAVLPLSTMLEHE